MKTTKLVATLAVCFLCACQSLKITHEWKAQQNNDKAAYRKILVLGLIPEKDRRIQQNMEDHVAGDLTDLGYNATTSLKEFGPKAFDGMDETTALAKLQNKGIDAVITIVLLNKVKERRYVPGQVTYAYGPMTNFWDYRSGLNNRILEPGYYVTNTNYFWESNFFSLQDKQLLYSVQTRSFDPKNSWSMGHEYGHAIVSAMLKKKVIANRRNEADPE